MAQNSSFTKVKLNEAVKKLYEIDRVSSRITNTNQKKSDKVRGINSSQLAHSFIEFAKSIYVVMSFSIDLAF